MAYTVFYSQNISRAEYSLILLYKCHEYYLYYSLPVAAASIHCYNSFTSNSLGVDTGSPKMGTLSKRWYGGYFILGCPVGRRGYVRLSVLMLSGNQPIQAGAQLWRASIRHRCKKKTFQKKKLKKTLKNV